MAFYLWHTEIKSIYSICGTHLCFPVYVTYYFTAYNILSILHSVTPVFSTPCRAIKNNDISNTSMQKRCINYLSYKSCSSQPNILAPPPNCNVFMVTRANCHGRLELCGDVADVRPSAACVRHQPELLRSPIFSAGV